MHPAGHTTTATHTEVNICDPLRPAGISMHDSVESFGQVAGETRALTTQLRDLPRGHLGTACLPRRAVKEGNTRHNHTCSLASVDSSTPHGTAPGVGGSLTVCGRPAFIEK